MPDSCCVYGCTNRRNKENGEISFYRLPTTKTAKKAERRSRWVSAIHREKWTEKAIDNARICSAHFVTG